MKILYLFLVFGINTVLIFFEKYVPIIKKLHQMCNFYVFCKIIFFAKKKLIESVKYLLIALHDSQQWANTKNEIIFLKLN